LNKRTLRVTVVGAIATTLILVVSSRLLLKTATYNTHHNAPSVSPSAQTEPSSRPLDAPKLDARSNDSDGMEVTIAYSEIKSILEKSYYLYFYSPT